MKRSHYAPLSRRTFIGRFALGAAAVSFPSLSLRGATAKPKKLGLALIGLGNYSRGELGPALKETEFVRLAGVVTGTRAKGEQWATEYGFSEKNIYDYATMDRLADNPEIDLVYVVTPPGLHAEHSIRSSKAGKHVICEKTMANTVVECDAMLAASRAAKRALAIGYRLHYDPYHMELMRLARENEFGPFMKMNSLRAFKIGLRNGVKPWRVNAALAGGGALMDVGIYANHAAWMATGAVPVSVTAQEEPKVRPEFFNEVEETLNYKLEFANGATCDVMSSYERSGNTFRAEAERGWFELNPAFSYRGLKGATSKGPLNYPPLRQQAKHMDAIAKSLIDGTTLPTPGELGRSDMTVIEAIYAAAKSGKRERVKA